MKQITPVAFHVLPAGQLVGDYNVEGVDITLLDFKHADKSTELLIETAGAVNKQIKALEKYFESVKLVLKTRLSPPEAGQKKYEQGQERWQLEISTDPRTALSQEKLKAKFGEDDLVDCYETTYVTKYSFKSLEV